MMWQKMIEMVALLVLLGGLAGCESAALQYARAMNPNCTVTSLEQRGDAARVLVACPDEDPHERVYRGR